MTICRFFAETSGGDIILNVVSKVTGLG